MLSFWQGAERCIRRTTSREGKRRIFSINPAKQCSTFFGIRGYQRDTRRRRQKGNRWRINNLKNVKTERVPNERKRQKNCNHYLAAARRIPVKKKCFSNAVEGEAVHRGGVAASATAVTPCSSAAFATSATVS